MLSTSRHTNALYVNHNACKLQDIKNIFTYPDSIKKFWKAHNHNITKRSFAITELLLKDSLTISVRKAISLSSVDR